MTVDVGPVKVTVRIEVVVGVLMALLRFAGRMSSLLPANVEDKVEVEVEVVALGDMLACSMRVERLNGPAEATRLCEGPRRSMTSWLAVSASCLKVSSWRIDLRSRAKLI